MSSFAIRPPREAEWETLADLHLATWQETYAGQFPESEWGPEARARRIRMWKAICTDPRPGDSFAVAERGGQVVGLAGAGASQDRPAPRATQLWFIYLLASDQGSGAGQQLLETVLASSPASLWVLENNPRAVAFYTRNGFLPDGTRKPSGVETAGDEIRMVR
ncbi:MAG: GNAT family N-acetyltransferase [Acidobacteria bacterium]|nr:GNAT family N-acetyltransferase [Acidobacteriota bacterium]